jgi:hypothetical protein
MSAPEGATDEGTQLIWHLLWSRPDPRLCENAAPAMILLMILRGDR